MNEKWAILRTRMQAADLQTRVRQLCPEVPDEVTRDFLSRMDPEYFGQMPLAEVAGHLRLIAQLDLDHPHQVSIRDRPDGLIEVVLVAYDYFSEFATVCGLLSAFGLDIREGRIYTYAAVTPGPPQLKPLPVRRRPAGRAGLSRKKIVDLFLVKPLPGLPFGPEQRQHFLAELDGLIRLLDANRYQDARSRVNRRLIEALALAHTRATFTGLLEPVQIRFDNSLSPHDTVIDIRSLDTPAFLYAFANALAMRGIYISKARFENVGVELHDRFYVRGRHGQKLEGATEQQELRVTAVLIKQFTHFLGSAPDPAKALAHFDQFLDHLLQRARGGMALKPLTDKQTLASLARLLGTSDFLWEEFLRRQHVNLLPVLDEYRRYPLVRPRAELLRAVRARLVRRRDDEDRRRILNQFKDQELFRIDMRRLLDPTTSLPDFSLALTELAEAVLDQAIRECQARLTRSYGVPTLRTRVVCPFAVFGVGKFGGRELGYASDIELLFVYGGSGRTRGRRPLENSEYFERLVQEILQFIEAKQEGIFHLDVRLRPHGGKGVLANTLDEFRTYYSAGGFSVPFERQALIKLRFVCGDTTLGRQVEDHRNAFVYGNEPWDLTTAIDLRRRQVKELVTPGTINAKYSPGALIDIEYSVQYLQLMHGSQYPSLRTTNTLQAIAALRTVGILGQDDADHLRGAYLFFRTLIDGLRIVRGNAKDLVLPSEESEEFVFLARRIGYATEDWQAGAASLAAELTRHMALVRAFFAERFGTLEAGSTCP